jgi:rubrerythrin
VAARVAARSTAQSSPVDRHCRWCTEGIEMSDTTKPDYLGLLNRISLAERNAGIYLKAWADVTPDAGLRRALALVAARETTHAEVFRQRIERLGFSLIEHDDPEAVERTRVYGDAARSDAEKVAAARRRAAQFDAEEFFRSIDQRVADESVDSLTRDTLRWFVGEERDSRALLSVEYERIEAMAGVEAT